jgi:hypothetical protein
VSRNAEGFDPSVPLPPELKLAHIRKAIDYIEKEVGELVDLYYEQANTFSALIGIFGVRALSSISPYKKHKHPDIAQQRFPDLSLKGRVNPSPNQALESKGSTRPWALQAHYDHPGWYIVWRYLIDPTRSIKPGREVIIWRVDVVCLQKEDWKYEGSKATEGRGGRTHTFGLKNPSKKLHAAIVYQHPKIVLRQGGPTLANGNGADEPRDQPGRRR